ncbi:alcohol dehydrogenase catalytic domain-containing protein [Dactylosporangium sp. NPDC000244]|uniref:alcohol dehydrogenase catalytic domain-containing protein n=1 Tax=Dactylosporangium sp. NPDC000244 TaxID=3154365 RepID=UPI00331C0065
MSAAGQIEVVAVGVCGSDVQRLRAGFDVRSLGHEVVGRGPDGQLLAVRPLNPCRSCPACARGWTEQCPNDASIGRFDTRDGGFSGRVRVTSGQLYPIPERLPVTVATLADPLACVLHALHDIAIEGVNVLIIGDGPLAALAAIHARHRAAAQVTIVVKDGGRTERMSGFADSVATADAMAEAQYDVVLESVGGISSEPILTAVTAVAPLGQVVALGVYAPNVAAGIPVRTLLEKESSLRGSKAYRVNDDRDDFAAALDLLAIDPRAYAPVITSTPSWSPHGPQPPVLERRTHTLKIVYVNEPATARRLT